MLPSKPITGVAAAALVAFMLAARCAPQPPPAASVLGLIEQAGNADDEVARLAILHDLQNRAGLDAQLRQDVDRMVEIVRVWLDPKYLWGFIEWSEACHYEFGISERSPLYPLLCLYRGRMAVWMVLEGADPGDRRRLLAQAAEDFRTAQKAFPSNRISAMYLGQPQPWPQEFTGTEGAPEWAALQRESLERLADIVHWWIDHRLRDDGQFGGGWGDDCEMWRWWVPVLIGFEDPKIVAAQEKFSATLMSLPHMQGGYTVRPSDVEHAAEPSADAISPMLLLNPNDLVWEARAMRLAERMATLWTGRNERGYVQFKSTYFAFDTVDANPRGACDTVYHPRAVQPALLLWQRTGDRRLTELFSSWMDTWVAAAASTDHGKPAGVLPSAIHWPDGRVGGVEEQWWNPKNFSSARLYRWPSAMSIMLDTLLLTYHITGDEKYLAPLRSMAAIRLKWLNQRPCEPAATGSEAWCAEQLGFLVGALAKCKQLTGTSEFDPLLAKEGFSCLSQQVAERGTMVAALRDNAEALRVNFAGYTSEVRYTDRVLRFPSLFTARMMFAEPIPAIKRPNPQLLYSLATGDPGDGRYFPLAAVRWLTPPREIAALVTETGRDRLAAELYHFGTGNRPMQAELYLLSPGDYAWTLEDGAGLSLAGPTPVAVSGRRTRVGFELPPRRLCVLRVAKPR